MKYMNKRDKRLFCYIAMVDISSMITFIMMLRPNELRLGGWEKIIVGAILYCSIVLLTGVLFELPRKAKEKHYNDLINQIGKNTDNK